MSCNEWKTVKLKDICDYKTGRLNSNAADENGIYPFFTCSPEPYRINSYSFDQDAIILAGNNANGKFHINYYNGKFDAYQRTYIMKTKDEDKVDNIYLYYYLSLQLNYLREISVGSATRFLTKTILDDIDIKYPAYSQMKSIGKILRTLDDKIELNNEMNKTLEEMAQSLFKRWFVDFEFPNEDGEPYKSSGGDMVDSELGMIPKGWEVKELGDVIHINPRESIKKGEDRKYVEMANLPLNYARVTNYVVKSFSGGTKFRNGDTLLARITPCLENGKTAIVDFLNEGELAFGSTEYIVMRPNVLNKYYIYCFARYEDFRNFAIKNMNGSSGRQRVDVNTIKQYTIVCPSKEILVLFNNLCDSLFSQMKKNDDNSYVLSEIRDILLPKLMNGEIKV